MKDFLRSKLIPALTALLLVSAFAVTFAASGSGTHAANQKLNAATNLDCNGFGAGGPLPAKLHPFCADFTIDENGQTVRGEDNGHYIGHDEPMSTFFSTAPGSGNNVQWHVALPKERPLPATQTFENYVALRFDMALCDNQSDPIGPCTPDSDMNNPVRKVGNAGSAILGIAVVSLWQFRLEPQLRYIADALVRCAQYR